MNPISPAKSPKSPRTKDPKRNDPKPGQYGAKGAGSKSHPETLESITWERQIYQRDDNRRVEIEKAATRHWKKAILPDLGVTKAVIKSSFHTSGGGPGEHITVDYLRADGTHMTTQQIYGDDNGR